MVVDAYAQLVAEGFLVGRAGSGTVVSDVAHRVHGRGRHAEPVADLDRPSRCFHRRCTILWTTGVGVRFGCRWGREDRSTIPAGPSQRYRSAHFFAVRHDTSYRSAARGIDQSSSTTRRASRSRARGVRAALAWVACDTTTSRCGVERFLDRSTPHREVFTHLRHQTVSTHDLDQRAWASHLGVLGPPPISCGLRLFRPRRSRSSRRH